MHVFPNPVTYKHVIVLFFVDTKASEKLTPLLLNSKPSKGYYPPFL